MCTESTYKTSYSVQYICTESTYKTSYSVQCVYILGQVVQHGVVGEQLGEGEAPDLYQVSVIVITAENLSQNSVKSVLHANKKKYFWLRLMKSGL